MEESTAHSAHGPLATGVPTHHPQLIGGEWVDASSGATLEVMNPATGEPIATVPNAAAEDVDRAVEGARRALASWLDTTPRERAELLLRIAETILANADELALIESTNVGKPRARARTEMEGCADAFRFFAGAARTLEAPAAGEYLRGHTSMVRREPIGVVGGIAPWNYPLSMASMKVAPGLAAGNVCILKPAEQTPLTALRLGELIEDILPPGVLSIVTGNGESAGASLVRHPAVRMISLTGDVSTGKLVAEASAQTLKRVHLELGGKSPVVVFDDADLELVREGLRKGSFGNSGQSCMAASRVLCSEKIYDRLLEAVVGAAESIRFGDPAEGDVDMGPVVSRTQQVRIFGFIERAEGTLLTGGTDNGGSGYFVTPTVMTDVQQRSEIVQREVFGPVVTVQRFADDAEALAMANDVDYGLAASVWTTNLDRALAAMRTLHFGTVWVNCHQSGARELPHGGFKESGYGKDNSLLAIEEWTNVKTVTMRIG